MKVSWLSILFLALLLTGVGHAQPVQKQPLRGVVWQVPEELGRAEAALRAMKRAGVEAVRTGPIRREHLFTLADTLGLVFFQDLPAAYLSAGALRDTLGFLIQALEQMMARASGHPSAQYFGLVRLSDTSDPAACTVLARLAMRIEAVGRRSYYLTPFVEAEACAGTADLVLLDALGRSVPTAVLARWRVAHPDTSEAAVGLGTLGVGVAPDAGRGLRAAHSPETQARYFEQYLPPLLTTSDHTFAERPYPLCRTCPQRVLGGTLGDTSAILPTAVFVYRWRDPDVPGRGRALPGRRYGLHQAGGAPRPALRVVSGVFTGRQHVFAFPRGTASLPEVPWLVLLGWGVVVLLGVFYAGEPRFRRMIPRYFRARGFYREAVREGREVLIGASVVLLVGVSLGTGVLAAVFFEAVRELPAFPLILHVLAPGAQGRLTMFVTEPWLFVPVGAALYAGGLLVWAMLLALASRWWMPLYLSQTLMLAVWPRWPMLILMAGAVVASTHAAPVAVPLLASLGALWLLTALGACVRALYDYTALTRSPPYVALVLAAASPLIVSLALVVVWALSHVQELPFLWHLVVRA